MKKVLILLVVLASTIATAQEAVTLRLNYTKGDKFVMKMSQSMNSPAMMMNNVTEMTMEVTDVTEGVYTSEAKINKMAIDVMQGGMQMSYDSSKKVEEQGQMAAMMKSQIDPMLKVVITNTSNKFGKNIETKVEPSLPGTEQFKNQASINYPEKAVKVGDTWNEENNQQGVKTNVEYKVIKITADKVMLDANGVVSGSAEGTLTGTIEIDRASGIPLKSSMKNAMKVQGQDMKMDVNVTMEKM